MMRELSLADARKYFSDIINEVRYRHDTIILKKGDKSVAAIIDIELFNKLQSLESHTNNLGSLTNNIDHLKNQSSNSEDILKYQSAQSFNYTPDDETVTEPELIQSESTES